MGKVHGSHKESSSIVTEPKEDEDWLFYSFFVVLTNSFYAAFFTDLAIGD